MISKICTKCNKTKDLSEFHKQKLGKYGKAASCKECTSKAWKEKYRSDKDYREQRKKTAAQWQSDNPERAREINRKATSKHFKNNKHYYAARNAARRVLEKEQRCDCCSKHMLAEFYEARPIGYHVDHIIPLSRGGLHCIHNLQYLTAEENLKKGNKLKDLLD